uniref:NADH-ubiquinone oxidoreductase chain 3 n=1 Tax=Pselaphanus sp. QL-2013 TaxID=1421598 RepID=A0A0A6ZL39_9HYME|nr:NADH dehydrogenase subunit 3 [Pselaphanus sp. QL-2013]
MYLLLVMFFIYLIISLFFLLLNFFLSMNKKMYYEKIISFECGFDMLVSSRVPFSINFYLIAILFLIFDVEIVLLIPLIVSFKFLNIMNWMIFSILILFILLLGLEYEKKEGSLKWMI